MILCEFVIPWADNEKRPQSQVHQQRKAQLCKEFGGCTTYDAKGDWRHEGQDFIEMVTVYRVAVDKPADVTRLKEFARDFALRMKQKALFFSIIGKAEIINLEE